MALLGSENWAPRIDEIASGVVKRTFRLGDRNLTQGTVLTREELRHIPIANRNSLISNGNISVVPLAVLNAIGAEGASGEVEKHVVSLGFGRFDVVEGRKVNAAPLDRQTAYELADIPLPATKKSK